MSAARTPNPVASILAALAADKNIAPALAEAFDEHRTREQIDFEESTEREPENDRPYSPCHWADVPSGGRL